MDASRGCSVGNKDGVLAYLRSGRPLVLTFGIHRDVFDADKAASLHILTDGRYAWHEALAYYVENYDIELPPAFVDHVGANSYTVPKNIVTRDLELP